MTQIKGHAKSQRVKEIERLMQMRKKRSNFQMQMKISIWDWTVGFAKFLKSFLDVLLSLILLVLLSPILIITSILIYLNDPGPIFYVANRVGLNGAYFGFIKFRSMYVNADKMKDKLMQMNESEDGVIFKIRNDPRVTPIGKFIRRYSIDELPQLINVLKGDMSLVGPRPPLPLEVMQYTLEERKRLHVKPGITCLWQIKGRSDIPFRQQVQLDMEYIRSQGIKNDLVILLKTIPAVISGKGAY
ncbi:MAG: sugar transferase [Candidatus Cloacimonetes bacterium]|jgi:lipopolysaccharide/colanic/teichoic acid biosynthesis glycosyltransferase|nr:sugar transferase [Candidatus Cloacimonadota bacterium]MDY0298453.1 sugar transferase [Candidatus Cloacimonadaceae bacterium]MCB5278823.1 sugar transferase [Candidatus Cloacimonadota bacterium]MCK9332602.1 sugar transferase [Candidatus Cloacimonadota bacterium]MDD2210138.1 sugar transferase [Candidatus Cloacimonadota bacterium]